MAKVMKVNWMLMLAITFACSLLYLFYTMSWDKTHKAGVEYWSSGTRGANYYDVWPLFQAPQNELLAQKWFQQTCLRSDMELSIANISPVLSQWSKTSDPACRKLLGKFYALYTVSTRNASLLLPRPFQEKVHKWLGNNKKLFEKVYNQEIIHIVNQFTREHTIFNPLRDKRPVLPPDEPETEYFSKIVEATGKTCDFCNFKNFTAEHTFHRVENVHAFSASNTFKMDVLHALFAMKQHNPIQWSPAAYMGLMSITVEWFQKAHKTFPSARFPAMIWDVLPKCGASQVHPHIQGFLDPERYHGVVESWRRGAQDYYRQMGTNFYMDMANVSASLGLGVTHRTAVALASLVPRKDHEVVIMAPTAGKDFFEMVYFVLRAFVDDLGKFCFSMGLAYPALDGLEAVIPAYARVITRGTVTDIRADMSSLELFTATNVNIDPFKVAQLIRKSVEKRQLDF